MLLAVEGARGVPPRPAPDTPADATAGKKPGKDSSPEKSSGLLHSPPAREVRSASSDATKAAKQATQLAKDNKVDAAEKKLKAANGALNDARDAAHELRDIKLPQLRKTEPRPRSLTDGERDQVDKRMDHTASEVRKAETAVDAARDRAATSGGSIADTIRKVFGPYGDEAVRVAQCESGLTTTAANGEYLGLFQMGSSERATYGHGSDALTQAKAAHKYFKLTGSNWGPWSCKP